MRMEDWRWCGCPRWPSLMATVESSDMHVVVELGVPLEGGVSRGDKEGSKGMVMGD